MHHCGNHEILYYGGLAASLHEYRNKNTQVLWFSWQVVQPDSLNCRRWLTGLFAAGKDAIIIIIVVTAGK